MELNFLTRAVLMPYRTSPLFLAAWPVVISRSSAVVKYLRNYWMDHHEV